MTCVGEPISWLRLEHLALGERDAAASTHLEACAACRHCLDEIRADIVALPPLVVPERRARAAWWRWAVPAMGLAAAAAVALLVVKPGPHDDRVATVKGAGEVSIDVVRERDGAIAIGATTFRSGDRWKLVVTCAPGAATWIDVAVVEVGSRATPDYPIPPARVACGNQVVLPGAFELTGVRDNRICAVLGGDATPARAGLPADGVACVTVRPE